MAIDEHDKRPTRLYPVLHGIFFLQPAKKQKRKNHINIYNVRCFLTAGQKRIKHAEFTWSPNRAGGRELEGKSLKVSFLFFFYSFPTQNKRGWIVGSFPAEVQAPFITLSLYPNKVSGFISTLLQHARARASLLFKSVSTSPSLISFLFFLFLTVFFSFFTSSIDIDTTI